MVQRPQSNKESDFSQLLSLEEIRGPMLFYGVCVILLNWVFGSALAGFVNDQWDKPIFQNLLFYLLSSVAISGSICFLFAIISSVILRLLPKTALSNLQISLISIITSVTIIIGLQAYAKNQFHARQKQKLEIEKQLTAELSHIAKNRPLGPRCWGRERKIEEFYLGPIFTNNFKGGVDLPSQASTILLVAARQGSPIYYEGNVVAYGFTMHFCFVSLKDNKVMQYTLRRDPPGSISVKGYGNVRFESHVRREAKEFFKHVIAGHHPKTFKVKTKGVTFKIGSTYVCKNVGDPKKKRKICTD